MDCRRPQSSFDSSCATGRERRAIGLSSLAPRTLARLAAIPCRVRRASASGSDRCTHAFEAPRRIEPALQRGEGGLECLLRCMPCPSLPSCNSPTSQRCVCRTLHAPSARRSNYIRYTSCIVCCSSGQKSHSASCSRPRINCSSRSQMASNSAGKLPNYKLPKL